MRRLSVVLSAFVLLSFVPSALGGTWNYVESPTDFWVELPETAVLDASTVLCYPEPVGYCPGLVDSHLWIYSEAGDLLAANDDSLGEYGWTLASHIAIELPAGRYRIRAGRCCGDPDGTWNPGFGYYLSTSVDALSTVSPSPSVEPSVEPSLEPSPTATPTPTEEPSPTPEPTPEPTPTPSPSVPVETPTPPVEASPSPTPSPTQVPESPSPTPSPTPTATPAPTPPPPPSPTEPPPSPTEPPPSPTEPPPSPTEPPPTPTEPPPAIELPSPDEVVAAIGETVDAAVAAVVEVGAKFARLGTDLTPEEREKMAAPVVASVIISQVGGAIAAASVQGSGPRTGKGPK